MMKQYVNNLALQMGITLSNVSLTESYPSGSHDSYILSLISDGRMVTENLRKAELDNVKQGSFSELLESKVNTALGRLKILMGS